MARNLIPVRKEVLEQMLSTFQRCLLQVECHKGFSQTVKGKMSRLRKTISHQSRRTKPGEEPIMIIINAAFYGELVKIQAQVESRLRKAENKLSSLKQQYGRDNITLARQNVGINPDVMSVFLKQLHPEA